MSPLLLGSSLFYGPRLPGFANLASIISATSSMLRSRSEMLADIAMLSRSDLWMRQKLYQTK
jgi:hypothetical protein